MKMGRLLSPRISLSFLKLLLASMDFLLHSMLLL